MNRTVKKVIIAITVIISAMLTCLIASASDSMEIKASVDYDNSIINFECKTPARYGQKISVVLYKQGETISSPSQLMRIADVTADFAGTAKGSFKLNDDDESGYYIVSAAGGGYMAAQSSDSTVVYFETQIEIREITIPAVNNADKSTIEQLMKEKQLLFGIELGEDYENNKEEINSLFVSIRKNDYNNAFTKMHQINDTLNAVNLIRSFKKTADKASLKSLCEPNAVLLELNLNEQDYKGHESEVYSILLLLIKENPPASIKNIRDTLKLSMGIAAVNRKNALQVTESIIKYAAYFDIDVDEYERACSKYTETEVNKTFVGRNFGNSEGVKEAYQDRLTMLKEKERTENGGQTGGGGRPSNISVGKELFEEVKKEDVVLFSDLGKNHWSYEYVAALAGSKVINGFEDGSFRPDDSVMREQFVKMLVLAFGIYSEKAECDFTDVTKDNWAYPYIASAKEIKLIDGYGDNSFGMGKNISRQDAAVIIFRLAKNKDIKYKKLRDGAFTDRDTVFGYALEAVEALQQAGIIEGDEKNRFMPEDFLTRAQAAKIIHSILSVK